MRIVRAASVGLARRPLVARGAAHRAHHRRLPASSCFVGVFCGLDASRWLFAVLLADERFSGAPRCRWWRRPRFTHLGRRFGRLRTHPRLGLGRLRARGDRRRATRSTAAGVAILPWLVLVVMFGMPSAVSWRCRSASRGTPRASAPARGASCAGRRSSRCSSPAS